MDPLKDKSILLVSPEPWEYLFVSKHHYAIELAKRGNRVFFLNPPTGVLRVHPTDYDNLQVVDYRGFWKGLHRMPKFLRKHNQRQVFQKIEKLIGSGIDLIWSFDNSVFYDFDALPDRVVKISHIVDLNQDFNTERASSSADVCFGVIPQIVSRHLHYNRNTYLIKHAVSIQFRKHSELLPGQNEFKVLYFGNLGMPHLDWEVIKKASEFSFIDFIFLGSNQDCVPSDISHKANVFLKDSVPSDHLMGFMEQSSVLILFYKSEYYADCASPHKLLEYLSSGKPVLTFQIEEYLEENGLLEMAKTRDEWLKRLKEIYDRHAHYSNSAKEHLRKEFAYENTYQKRIGEIAAFLKK